MSTHQEAAAAAAPRRFFVYVFSHPVEDFVPYSAHWTMAEAEARKEEMAKGNVKAWAVAQTEAETKETVKNLMADMEKFL